ncbi:ATP-dependent DNA helicase PIF1 [Coprinopsis cinerea okayama7|uniref:ATP-dependent DNA helicase n=1 Tax=Coprinopsis cinerea (strain Okayama-7 / 130 / ATCC MYA-4618 / FGSC 9003) TaxID=240176 RepID=A8PIK1_COPC7|nr:ATP-dependent DNA helicase PIF1 [Coprinopsis cinerea okayama7\|eukprot:XP_001841583.1 ATP-dependent DNA helicase PIF1 [Coprinopsis cinerea okayama7\
MYVGGSGGTGKSHIIKAIVTLFKALGRFSELLIGAPTGIAVTLIGGTTLHSLLMVGTSSKAQINPRLYETWRPVQYLIVDEVSMLGAQFMALLSTRLKIAKGDDIQAATRNFGGINIIFMGDFCQLAPPKQKSLYSYQLVREPSFAESRNMRGFENVAGAYLWRQVSAVVLLKKNQRQSSDSTFATILNHICEGTCRDDIGREVRINGRTILAYLREREISRVAVSDPLSLKLFSNAPVVVGSKTLRDVLNANLVRYHASRTGKSVFLYHSIDSTRAVSLSHHDYTTLWDLPSRKTQESLGRLPLFIGMRVMVTENVSIPYRVVNGAEGEVVDIVYSWESLAGVKIRVANAVYVKITGSNLKLPGFHPDVVPLCPRPVSVQLPLVLEGGAIKGFRRRQVPIVPAYSYTDYKSQGRSLDRVIVDLETARGQGLYVMLSRVRTLEGLLILTWTPSVRILQRMSGELRTELDRLKELDRLTLQESLALV